MKHTTETPTQSDYYWVSIGGGAWEPVMFRILLGSAYLHRIGSAGDVSIDFYKNRGIELRWKKMEDPNNE